MEYTSPMFRFHTGSTEPYVAQATQIDLLVVRFLRRGSAAPRGLRLGGHQHPAENAVDPEHAEGKRARNLLIEALTVRTPLR